MRPAGGVAPDMMDYAHSTDVFKIWADMVVYDKRLLPDSGKHQFCVFVSRRDGHNFALSHQQVMERYGSRMKQQGPVPKALSDLMADYMYLANFDEYQQVQDFITTVLAEK